MIWLPLVPNSLSGELGTNVTSQARCATAPFKARFGKGARAWDARGATAP